MFLSYGSGSVKAQTLQAEIDNVGKGCAGGGGSFGSLVPQSPALGTEGDRRLEASHRSLGSQPRCDLYTLQDGGDCFGPRVNQGIGHDVLV